MGVISSLALYGHFIWKGVKVAASWRVNPFLSDEHPLCMISLYLGWKGKGWTVSDVRKGRNAHISSREGVQGLWVVGRDSLWKKIERN